VTLASLPEGEPATPEVLLAEADKRLYAVKKAHHAEHGPRRPAAGPTTPATAAATPLANPPPAPAFSSSADPLR